MKRSFFGYFVFIAACIVVSLYVHFPGRTAARYIERTFLQLGSMVTVSVEEVSLSFPPGIKTETIRVKHAGKDLLSLDNFKFFLRLRSFWGDELAGTYRTEVFDGELAGTAKCASGSVNGLETETRLDNLNLKNLFLGEAFWNCELSGILNGTVGAGIQQGLIGKGYGNVKMADIVLEFPEPVFSMDSYSFSTGTLTFDMPDQKTVKIKECILKGRQLDVLSSGDIRIMENLQKSRLKLKAQIVLYPLFFMGAGDAVPAEVPERDTENTIVHLKIGGTIQKPIITVDPGTK